MEEDYLNISSIQHFIFCKRQWAILYLEDQWQENFLTAEGRIIHEKAHDGSIKESRKDYFVIRSMPVKSHKYKITGVCDIVEFIKDTNGINLKGKSDKYKIYPVEYKRGNIKKDESDKMQLLAQCLSLEEMFVTKIRSGSIYYNKTRKREEFNFTENDIENFENIVREMHRIYKQKKNPKVRISGKCKKCSVYEICMPNLSNKEDVVSYINRKLEI